MNDKALVQTVLAIRSQLQAAEAQINALLFSLDDQPTAEDVEPVCLHPPESRLNLTTMGGPASWQCRLCGHTQEDC